ncbi:unnamed protein product [Fraxinus pennsylvanica]|uniref:DRBM domain-containing protein n=1 Tax=Fraxinus pennsylvanica TaxID=56036 RepID=A0AAD2E262_9LAMI|nr:unnamed protein product [Fraxinus pennsylvanica]
MQDETGIYKNLLEETTHRARLKLPLYTAIRAGLAFAPLFSCPVELNRMTFAGEPAKTKRQAQKSAAMAAWFALKNLRFNTEMHVSVNSPLPLLARVAILAFVIFDCAIEKGLLSYGIETEKHAAAEVALRSLSQRGPSRALTARVLDETGIYKNLLEETAHRARLKLPLYTAISAGPAYAPLFSCPVELNRMTFAGEPAKTKKQAQKSAAMAAWFALKNSAQQESCSSVSSLGRKDEQEQVTVARYYARLKLPETRNQHRKRGAKSETSLYSFTGVRPVFYFSNDTVPRPIGINSQITIEEIQENAQGEECEETRVIHEANSAQWRVNSPSNASLMPTEAPDYCESFNNNPSLRREEFPSEKGEVEKSRSVHDIRNSVPSSSRPTRGPLACPPCATLRARTADGDWCFLNQIYSRRINYFLARLNTKECSLSIFTPTIVQWHENYQRYITCGFHGTSGSESINLARVFNSSSQRKS